MIEEDWEDIKGYEGKYQVSIYGNIRSINYNNTGKPKNLKQKINKRTGHSEVKLSKNNKTKDFMVARLVAEAFIPNPKNCPIVTHLNNNKQDNSIFNLKWVYVSESRYLMYKKGNRKIGKPSNNKISYKGVSFQSYSDMARYYSLSEKQLFKRLEHGWSLDEALNIPVSEKNKGGKPKFYNYYGRILSSKQICKLNNIDIKLFNKRIGRGWNVYEASEIEKGVKNG